MSAGKYTFRPAPSGIYAGSAHLGLFLRRPASPVVRANTARRNLVKFFNRRPNHVNFTDQNRIMMRAEYEKIGVTKTQMHQLADKVFKVRLKRSARSPSIDADHLHELKFWSWLEIITRRSNQLRPSPKDNVINELSWIVGVKWDPWANPANPNPPRRRSR